ncbi:uncharacterized protein (DUF2141 family) [Algoriphagus boseongensis]|uniref:Uncharacterized protein (DUF2141 family) n=1 Tax=Algoriphagus boseongensis TaxID=1442587 RepID=A0A4R6T9I5_9BACT|nr:DUF2141 domain-containing protein [Algoriphagus boseongensis]TDQ19421.1 uncharacterized protein (DUF2141 family) [Algoriphagus boseongensis]
MIFLILSLFLQLGNPTVQDKVNTKLLIQIHHTKSDQGKIRILIFSSEKGFPDQPEHALKSYSITPKNKAGELLVEDLPEGKYAVSVIHDEDGNGKLNTNAVGYPSEKFGFSNNPKVYFSIPSFEKVAFQLTKEAKTILINLH